MSGLANDNSVTLYNNGGDPLTISDNTSFTFSDYVLAGEAYNVTVFAQPTEPNQTCVVSNGSGTVTDTDITDVTVICTTNSYTVGGVVSGLAVGNEVVLQNNGENELTVNVDGSFTFPTPLVDGSAYAVAVVRQPDTPAQICSVSNGTGFLSGSDVTGVTVDCVTYYELSLLLFGDGSVSSSPNGIDCPGACSAEFEAASQVSLNPIPNPEWTLGSWIWFGDCTGDGACLVDMDAGKSVEVEFQCDLITIPETLVPIDTAMVPWECDAIEAIAGFEMEGPAASVIFHAGSEILLGPGFRVGPEAVFQAIIGP